MNTATIFETMGFLGNAFLILGYLPQIYKTYKTKRAEDISLLMWITYLLGEIMLLIYAISVHDIIFILAPAIFAIGDIAIIILKLRYGLAQKTS